MCPKSSYPLSIVTYYRKWVTTSWTHSISKKCGKMFTNVMDLKKIPFKFIAFRYRVQM